MAYGTGFAAGGGGLGFGPSPSRYAVQPVDHAGLREPQPLLERLDRGQSCCAPKNPVAGRTAQPDLHDAHVRAGVAGLRVRRGHGWRHGLRGRARVRAEVQPVGGPARDHAGRPSALARVWKAWTAASVLAPKNPVAGRTPSLICTTRTCALVSPALA